MQQIHHHIVSWLVGEGGVCPVLSETRESLKAVMCIDSDAFAFSDLPPSWEAGGGTQKSYRSRAAGQQTPRATSITRGTPFFLPEFGLLGVKCSSSQYPLHEHVMIEPAFRTT